MRYSLYTVVACVLFIQRLLFGQTIELNLDHEITLPAADGSWAVAALPDGRFMTMIGANQRIYYSSSAETVWDSIAYSADIFAVGIDSDGLYMLCNSNHIRKIYIPSGYRTDPIVYWPDVHRDDPGGRYDEVNVYQRGTCYPSPPEQTEIILIDGHTSGGGCTHLIAPYTFSYKRMARITSAGNNGGTWNEARQYYYDLFSPRFNPWIVEWEHSNAIGWQYTIAKSNLSQNTTRNLYIAVIDFAVSSPVDIGSAGVCMATVDSDNKMVVMLPELAAGQARKVVALDAEEAAVPWTYDGSYRNLFACNVQDSTAADEILCLNAEEPSFDILSYYGAYKGTTELFAGKPDDIKLIAPRGPHAKLAVRDGDTLRVFSFGPIPMTSDDYPSADPPDDDPPDNDPPDTDPPIDDPSLVMSFSLSAYPNPFNPVTILKFSLPEEGTVVLDIYDVVGKHVQSLLNHYLAVGEHAIQFDGSPLPSGVYFAVLHTPVHTATQKLLLLK